MFSYFFPTTTLASRKETKLAPNVQAFTQDWEKDVRNQLTATKSALLCCRKEERQIYKEKAKTLNDVLHLLQGQPSLASTNLRKEMESSQMQLQKMTSDYRKTKANYTLQKKINTDLKIQLNRQFEATNEAADENRVLCLKVESMMELYRQRLDNSAAVKYAKTTTVLSLQQAAYQAIAAKLSDQRKIITKLRDYLSEADRKLSARHQEIESMKELYSHRLGNSLPFKGVTMKTAGVPSLQQSACNTLADTLSNHRRVITESRDNFSKVEMKLNISECKFQNMKALYSQRLKKCLPVKDLMMKTTGVPSLQQAAYQTLAATMSDQRKIITMLRDKLSEAEIKLQQARVSFKIKEEELQKRVQTLMERLESQKNVVIQRPNIFILVIQQLYRWFCSCQSIRRMCTGIRMICFW